MGQPLPYESEPRLLFAGEATHPQFWGQMLGARLSGIREAQRIIDRIGVVDRIEHEMHKISTLSISRNMAIRQDADDGKYY